ncbi:DUF7221 family queuine tRNA-ribosyltransferase-like protein [Rhizobium leguminosarum]|uniref:deazapurine DNA modification protein DpdA family protein n=1 Tax=Rhizobium leguminosarum TaxID=384 RepID=UPI000B9297F9|nr:hypothetical protein [Rhizobium leguminosarum]ASS57601.1 hypothetical protein CHR56_25295 [Rhizobium leguminosarum bv. viciae]MBA9034955.1 hypothetical protein [Rhizobium leguminosarum]TBY17476.1 hypothetical protein E0H30_25995 [Rhizobium leguminosarum bv. viciae]TBY24634.1 hypothetical protein E0H37_23225 [Rhizobium leguminosarum bv. viciae]TBY99702.1 hypothetical protein E0H49_17455 [Rhizobium leguminosarum bv. viciae]
MSGNVKFYVGLHQPSDAQHFDLACISINRLRGRKKEVPCGEVLVDSGAFTEISKHGRYRHSVAEYAAELYRLYTSGVVKIAAAVAQDYMCEPFILAKTGLTIEEHQRLTIERYDALVDELQSLFQGEIPFHVMPVLQGFAPHDYVNHVRLYGERLKPEMWVGVGSVCKRQGDPRAIMAVLQAIHRERPELLLHGFGVKITSLLHPGVRELLATADSMAWSFAARKQGRDANDWHEADRLVRRVKDAANQNFQPWQMEMFA